MAGTDLEQVLDVISKAIARETASFNYYYMAASDGSLPDGVRGLLSKLAEEERIHRKMLLGEYSSVQRAWGDHEGSSAAEDELSYDVPEHPEIAGLASPRGMEVKAVTLPAKLLGGDSVLTRITGNEETGEAGLFLTLYDVMGHGIETTAVNAAVAEILGEYLDGSPSGETTMEAMLPSRVVTHLNRLFCSEFEGSGTFVTLVSVLVDPIAETLIYTTAGHEPPLIARADSTIDSLYYGQLLIGIDRNREYVEHSVPFGRGDFLCLFSDGILEAEGPGDAVFGGQRLRDSLARHAGRSPEEIILGVIGELRDFCSGRPLKDELTLAVAGSPRV